MPYPFDCFGSFTDGKAENAHVRSRERQAKPVAEHLPYSLLNDGWNTDALMARASRRRHGGRFR